MSEPKKTNLDFLWKSFLKGDDKSFSLIYQQHIDGLFLYGSKLCADRELVRDCIQEIFVDLFLKRKKDEQGDCQPEIVPVCIAPKLHSEKSGKNQETGICWRV
jgi:hypothetical protein